MKEIILIKDGELSLKGLNRNSFEDVLVKNIKYHINDLGSFQITKSQSTIMVDPLFECDMDELSKRISKVFGIAAFSRAAAAEKDMDEIIKLSKIYLRDTLNLVKTFKVEAKRSDKRFPFNSPQICSKLGEELLSEFSNLSVDVHNPDVTVVVEVRDHYAFIRANQIKGAGGMPVGTAGNSMLLISGGIDSPVAGYMMARRGVVLKAVHFASPPYTSQMAEEKVHRLLAKVADFSGRIKLTTIHFTEIQEQIKDNCPEEFFTIIMRRMMMRVANALALENDCNSIITGESLGQVASQTMLALGCTDVLSNYPVFRPLIGMDKDDIITISRKIDTFDISIEPYEDCCTVFTPKHPKTKPNVLDIEKAESSLSVDELIERALENKRIDIIKGDEIN